MTLMHILTIAIFIALGSLGLSAMQDAFRMMKRFWVGAPDKAYAFPSRNCDSQFAKQKLS